MNLTLRTLYTFLLFCFCISLVQAQSDRLIEILENDDLPAFQKLDKSESSGSPVFELSIQHGAEEICSYLLKQGADPLQYFESGAFPLLTAVNAQRPDMVQLLLDHGANPDQQQETGLQGTALMYAASRNVLEIPQILVAGGALVNLVDVNNDPAMNWASYYGNTKVMQWLIDQGADLSIKSKHGLPVDVGLRLWHADSVMEVFRANWKGGSLGKAEKKLYQAVQSNDLKAARKLLSKGASANTKDVLGTPLLQLSVQSNAIAMTRLLLQNGADPNQTNRVGMTPLAFAARFGRTECVDLLIKAEADPNMCGDDYKLTPLMGSAVSGDTGIAQRLMDAGASLNIRDVVNQAAAVHWAMLYGNERYALWLLESGADYKEPLLDGQYTTSSIAAGLRMPKVVNWIAADEQSKHPVEGSWKLKEVHYQYLEQDTTIEVNPALQGRITFSEQHYHLLYNPWTNERKAFADIAQPTPEEMQHAFQTLVFNSGSYEITDSTIVTTSDIARVPGFEGGKQYYDYSIVGNALTLTMYDETYPDGGKPSWYQKLKVVFKLTRE